MNRKTKIFERDDIEFKQILGKTYHLKSVKHSFKIVSKRDWFDIYATVQFGKFEIPFYQLKNNILSGKPEFELPDGSIAFIPRIWFSKYEDLFKLSSIKNKRIQLKKHHFRAIESEIKDQTEYQELKKLLKPEIAEIKIPEEINAELRDYQKIGFFWMKHLQDNGFGACLADDMGLGKTLQTICLLQYSKNSQKHETQKKESVKNRQLSIFDDISLQTKNLNASLIIMPVSLIHNWQNEIRKFSPGLSTLIYHGASRFKKRKLFYRSDIILSSYGTCANDIDFLEKQNFRYLVLDESQRVKNPKSVTYRAIRRINSEHKLILTGTPVQNKLTDLWAQMNLINPGLLKGMQFFEREFRLPIERYGNREKAQELKHLIKPFFLRRTKKEVEKDLPELSEQDIYCSMTEEQKKIYEKESAKIRHGLLSSSTSRKEKNNILIIKALTKLRQLACHPRMTEENYMQESGKFTEITQNLETLINQEHKVLVFSSFVKHLNLLAEFLHKNNYEFSELYGSTGKRNNIIREFKSNPKKRVFLISVKAGSEGLNLTEADYVFIIDPWWNPKVEEQALSRAYRIGQDKNVMVYRFITTNTVEEKIRKLQTEKEKLSDDFISRNNPLEALSAEDFEKLTS